MKNNTIITISLFIALITGFTGLNLDTYNNYEQVLEQNSKLSTQLNNSQCSIWNGYKQVYETKNNVNGLYWVGEDFYCVWADNRELEKIERTERHEYCHYLVDNDFDHFCTGVNAK